MLEGYPQKPALITRALDTRNGCVTRQVQHHDDAWLTGGVLLGCSLRPLARAEQCVSSGVRGGCAPVESSAGIGFAACAGKHYSLSSAPKQPFWRTHASVPVPSGLQPPALNRPLN